MRENVPSVNLCASLIYEGGSCAFRTAYVDQAKRIDLQTLRGNSAQRFIQVDVFLVSGEFFFGTPGTPAAA